MAFFLEGLQPELAQGDIVQVCAYGSLPPLQVVVRWEKDPNNATLYSHPLTTKPKRLRRTLFSPPDRTEEVVFEALEGRCLVLSNDCVSIAKAANQSQTLKLTERQKSVPWHVAPLRPWPGPGQIVDTTTRGKISLASLIEAGLVKKYWEIPRLANESGQEIVPRSYVDLRFLTPLKPSALRIEERIASLSDEGVGKLWAKLFSFFSGKSFPKEIRCRHCGKTSELELDELLYDGSTEPPEP